MVDFAATATLILHFIPIVRQAAYPVPDSKPSKSERKRAQLAIQRLGEQLIGLGDDLLGGLKLDDRLLDAVHAAQKMKSNEALRRHKQYIGKLMRDVDPAPIRTVLDRLRADDRREKRLFTNAERWRDRLLADDTHGLSEFKTDTGYSNSELGDLLDALAHAVSDRDRRTLSRRIFRCVHDVLAARSRDG